MNISLINSLAQVILSLPLEEQHLLQQQLEQQQQFRPVHSRRRAAMVESGDSFDSCVADSFPESVTTASHCGQGQDNILSQPKCLTTRSIEQRAQKNLFLFRDSLPS